MRNLLMPWAGHDLEAFTPLVEIVGAPWQDIAAGLNTALGFVGAHSLAHDGWADGQADSDEAEWALQLRYEIPPPPSPKHAAIRVTIWGYSPGEDGSVSIREVGSGEDWTVFEMPAELDATSGLVPTTAVDEPSQLELRVVGEVILRAVDIEVAAWVPDEWPDGELTGPLSEDLDIVPAELDDFADTEAVSARVLTDAREAAEHCRLRTRMYCASAAPRLGVGTLVRPLRAAAPVPSGATELTVKITAVGGADDGIVWIQLGQGGLSDIYRGVRSGSIEQVAIEAEAAEAVYTITRPLRDERLVDVPERYPGFSWIVAWATPGVQLLGLSMWGL